MRKSVSVLVSLVLVLITAGAAAATAKKKPLTLSQKKALAIAVPGCPTGAELKAPPELTPDKTTHVLSTAFDVRLQSKVQVPIYTNTGCSMKTFDLRNFGWPQPSGSFAYGFPGPTLRLRKGTDAQHGGDAFSILLTNNLPVLGDDKCNQGCVCSDPVKPGDPQCCFQHNGVLPNCFHGDNTVNLHFHGTHVSPQSPQDYVLLELRPYGSSAGGHAAHGSSGTIAVGKFQYAVNPLPWNQAEGTHWYHPHKHGATALHVVNGMAGAIIIEGPFDDWLRAQFPKNFQEKVMVFQTIHDQNFSQPTSNKFTPTPLINGQLMPQVTMYPGEIQRWRIISATTEADAQLTIDWNGPGNVPINVKQIAMDGIQFAPENYQSQPLVDPNKLSFNLSPGNRADFLVQAPTTTGKFTATFDVFGAVENQSKRRFGVTPDGRKVQAPTRADTRAVLEAIAPGSAQPGLISINVVACPQGQSCPAMSFPTSWPKMPSYLDDLPAVPNTHNMTFTLIGAPAVQPQTFAIAYDGGKPQQFQSDCAAITAPLGATQQWTINQNTANNPFHVFHIHTNPFQVVTNGTKTYAKPIWMDSITLPGQANGSIVMRTKYEDYTGPYVIHCHFLGHEDRGMMVSVQTVCPNNQTSWGTPVASGGPDNCSITMPALDPCANPPAPATKMKAAAKKTTKK